jgi:hypothetical protein
MSDDPRFPSPDEAKRKEAPKITPPSPTAPVVVSRADPVPESTDKKDVKLSPEEVRALLAVSDATRDKTKAQVLWKRGRVILIPIGLIDIALHVLFGDYAYVFMILVTIAGIVWTARPLFRKDGWD